MAILCIVEKSIFKGIGKMKNPKLTIIGLIMCSFFSGCNLEKEQVRDNIEQMKSTVGFIPKDGEKGGKVPQGMEASEFGGTDKEGLMYLSASRAYKNSKRLVKKSNRYDQTTRAQGHKKRIRTNGGKSSVMAMMASWQEGKPVFIKAKSGVKYLVKVNSVFDMSTGKRDFRQGRIQYRCHKGAIEIAGSVFKKSGQHISIGRFFVCY